MSLETRFRALVYSQILWTYVQEARHLRAILES
jgi:hypothetical protein